MRHHLTSNAETAETAEKVRRTGIFTRGRHAVAAITAASVTTVAPAD